MSLSLVTNPVITESGIVKNLFAGFKPVKYVFKREDAVITSIGQGIDNQVLLNVGIDLQSYLSIGDPVYVYSQGLTHTYNFVAQIVAITATTITVNKQYIEAGGTGYMNYKKNYYVEVQLTQITNTNVNILPFSLIDDGDNAGNITIDVSIANDLNVQKYEFLRQELTESRTIFRVKYREVYDEEQDNVFTELVDNIVLVYATEQPENETFLNSLDMPKFWQGYPYGIVLAHTNDNSDNTGFNFKYDELDVNQNDLTTDNSLGALSASNEGFLFININKDLTYNAQTKYIKDKSSYEGLNFFSPDFFDSTFFDA